eukprot:CAMPEP_0194066620 /NCGR_PEP_ID=MMETSP0009_2-20130614/86122_1 /TAXON_ID=210454 /ORGANISM="Grammatophora oceanica, Strain CCMP 410" /LENGTH=428 /DNA_ID=CAMNT_0038719591 /DNA_START=252 /DNA_END=1538 /DNA_ORIENTATION=+
MAVVVAAAVFVIALQFQYLLDLLTSFGDADLQVWSPISEVESLSEYPGTTYPDSWDGINTASACLLVLDENLRLPEWLAYHYHALPLRYLVISVDPRSQKSPSEILDRFRDQGMIIVEWSDYNFTDWEQLPPTASRDKRIWRHRYRQRRFYEACMTHLHHANRTWTAMYDADEFLTLKDTPKNTTKRDKRIWRHRYRQRRFYEACMTHLHHANRTWTVMLDADEFLGLAKETPQNTTKELVSKEGWFIRYVQDNSLSDEVCFFFRRAMFGAKEIPSNELYSDHPDELDTVDAMRLDTLRFRFHAHQQHELNGPGKSVIDVSKLREYLPLLDKVSTVHSVLPICEGRSANATRWPFVGHHYVGSWESYSLRDDPRKKRSRKGWEERASVGDMRNDQLSGWLKEFVALHGPERASVLLHEAGLSPDYRSA